MKLTILLERLRGLRAELRYRKPLWLEHLWHPMPVYITRKSANGETGTYSLGAGVVMVVLILVSANLVLWLAIGVYEAIELIVDI